MNQKIKLIFKILFIICVFVIIIYIINIFIIDNNKQNINNILFTDNVMRNITNNTSSSNNISTSTSNNNTNNINKNKIIAIGDSLTAGYGLPLEDSYPKILEKQLIANNIDVEVVNAGISGETTNGLLERIDFIKSQNPDIILITIGGNDALRNLPLQNTKDNLSKIIKSLKQNINADNIYLMQIQAPANFGGDYSRDFSNLYKEIAQSEKINLLPFVIDEVFLNPDMMSKDALHPNRKGYEFIVTNYIYKKVLTNLKTNNK